MWPFDNREKRAQIEGELVEAQDRLEQALRTEAPVSELRALSQRLGTLALKADRIASARGVWAVIRRARESAETREQGAMQARSEAVVDQLRACTGCKGATSSCRTR